MMVNERVSPGRNGEITIDAAAGTGEIPDHAMAAWMVSLALKNSQPRKTTTPEPALGERQVTIKL